MNKRKSPTHHDGTFPNQEDSRYQKKKQARILFLDIETSPNLGWVWGKWEQNVVDFEDYWYILSFSAKWLGGKTITKGLIDYPSYRSNKENDRLLVKDLWSLLDEADIIVAHNGDEFDIKKISTRFVVHKIVPPSPFKTVDTKKIAKKYFNFISNSLNDISQHLGIGKKLEHTGFELWKGCMAGDKSSWRLMKRYNEQDVVLLEKVYLQLLPWMKQHPNVGSYLEEIVCPKCGSDRLQSRGFYTSMNGVFRRFQCISCAGWGHLSKREYGFKVAKGL